MKPLDKAKRADGSNVCCSALLEGAHAGLTSAQSNGRETIVNINRFITTFFIDVNMDDDGVKI